MTKQGTPRVDALIGSICGVPHANELESMTILARQLERELGEARDTLSRVRVHLRQHCAPAPWLIEAIDGAIAPSGIQRAEPADCEAYCSKCDRQLPCCKPDKGIAP